MNILAFELKKGIAKMFQQKLNKKSPRSARSNQSTTRKTSLGPPLARALTFISNNLEKKSSERKKEAREGIKEVSPDDEDDLKDPGQLNTVL